MHFAKLVIFYSQYEYLKDITIDKIVNKTENVIFLVHKIKIESGCFFVH